MRDVTLWLLALSLTALLGAPATALPAPGDAVDLIQDLLDQETDPASAPQHSVDLHWQAPSDGEGYVYEVYRDGYHVTTTNATDYVDTLYPDPVTGLIHAVHEVIAYPGNDQQNVEVVFRGLTLGNSQPQQAAPVCDVIIISIHPGDIPPVAWNINEACIPSGGTPGATLPVDSTWRHFN